MMNQFLKFCFHQFASLFLQVLNVDLFDDKNLMDYRLANSFYFLRTLLHGLAIYGLTYSASLFFSYLSHALLDLHKLFSHKISNSPFTQTMLSRVHY